MWHKTKVFLLLEAEDLPELKPEPAKRYGPRGERLHAWTDVHSWLIVMGGLAFEDTAPEDQQFIPKRRQRVVFACTNIELLTRNGRLLIPDISREQLEDKSKSDMLGKMLTCWQAGYFCVQCIFRLSKALSITLLELNVFAHAICALLLFLIWWDKPRDVQEPLLIRDEEALDICAIMNSVSLEMVLHVRWKPKFDDYSPNKYFEVLRPTKLTLKPLEYGPFAIGPYEHPYLKIRGSYWALIGSETLEHEIIITLDHRDINRLDRACRAARQDRIETANADTRYQPYAVLERVPNWSLSIKRTINQMIDANWANLYSREFFWLMLGLTFAGACYGGLHLTAWFSQFPTDLQAILWRAASTTILLTGPSCALLVTQMAFTSWEYDRYLSLERRHSRYAAAVGAISVCIQWCGWLIPVVLSLLWYTLCRTFIVVGCFIMLTHIPESALQVPTWSAYIPHIV